MSKNIVLFTVSSKNIGPMKNITDIAIHLNRKNNVIVILCDDIVNNQYIKKLIDNKIKVFSLKMNSLLNIFSYIKLHKILVNHNTDILITRLRRSDFMGSLIGEIVKIDKIIANIVDDSKLHFNFYHKGIKGKILNYIYDISINYVNAIIVNSKSNYSILKKENLYKNKKIYFIPNYVDSQYYQLNKHKRKIIRKELQFKNSEFILGYIGRIEQIKGLDILINAFNNIKNKFPNIKLLIIGQGSLLNSINAMVNENPENITLINYTNDVPGYLSTIDLFIFPSKGEGMPNSLLEAMSIGLPVIGFKVRGVEDIIKNNYNGNIIRDRNSNSLEKKIEEILTKNININAYGKNARKYIVDNFNIDLIADSFDKIISE